MDKSPGSKAQTASSSTKPSTKCPWGVGRSSNGLSVTGNDLEGFYEALEAPSQKKRTVRLGRPKLRRRGHVRLSKKSPEPSTKGNKNPPKVKIEHGQQKT